AASRSAHRASGWRTRRRAQCGSRPSRRRRRSGTRRIGPWTLALRALSARGWSSDIYRWTDGAGNVHYSNMDAEGDDAAAVAHEPAAPSAEEVPADLTDDTAERTAARGDSDTFSADVSLRRTALERDLRATAGRLHEIDARL